MVRDWKIRSGFKTGFTIKDEKDFDPQFAVSYTKFQNYVKSNCPPNIKGTEEEMILDLIKNTGYNLKQVMKLKISFISIHNLIKEKDSYLSWYSAQEKPKR